MTDLWKKLESDALENLNLLILPLMERYKQFNGITRKSIVSCGAKWEWGSKVYGANGSALWTPRISWLQHHKYSIFILDLLLLFITGGKIHVSHILHGLLAVTPMRWIYEDQCQMTVKHHMPELRAVHKFS